MIAAKLQPSIAWSYLHIVLYDFDREREDASLP
jgi:hypothetical protein